MKAPILDGSFPGDETARAVREVAARLLASRGWTVEMEVLAERNIAPCRGCFGCWTYSAGECIIDDDGRKVAEEMAHADLWVYVTPVTFGGFSSVLKSGLDRLIPILLPFFRKYAGEVHHPSRYSKDWDIVGLGIMDRPDPQAEECFAWLVQRNSRNGHAHREGSAVLLRDSPRQELEDKVRTTLVLAGVMA